MLNKIVFAKAGTTDMVASTATVTDTGWHHLVATKSGSTPKVYLDGVDVTPVTVTNATLVNTTSALKLGSTSSANYLDGQPGRGRDLQDRAPGGADERALSGRHGGRASTTTNYLAS